MSAQRKTATTKEATPMADRQPGPQLAADNSVAHASPALALQNMIELELSEDRWPARQRATFLLVSGVAAWAVIFMGVSGLIHAL